VRVEIWTDVVCPWCYLGMRRFETALKGFEHRDQVEVLHRSFELDRGAPRQPEPTIHVLARKFGRPTASIRPMFDQVTKLAEREGLEYHLAQTQSGNTFDAHRLIHFAQAQGRGAELVALLFDAYFTRLRSVFDPDELEALAVEAGLDGDQARAVLGSDSFADAVRADEAQAEAYGAGGVPFFVFDGRFGISGAQPVDAFAETLDTAWATRPPGLAGAKPSATTTSDG
jgi:predicted DsbA family dithiol-disulfide isomerase